MSEHIESTDSEEKAEGGKDASDSARLLIWLLAILLIPVLYVLSIGPVAALYELTQPSFMPQAALEAFYFPVLWLHENTPLAEPLEKYVEMWGLL
ncbi:MAG: hypothetical protein ACOC29_03870 [Candidatus Sumerlaeota bacterium]